MFQQKHIIKIGLMLVVAFLASVIALPSSVLAISSNNYVIDEDFIGGTGNTESTSPNYTSQDSIGAPAAGDASGTNYRTQSGAQTTSDPALTFSVDTSNVNLGALSTSITRTGTANFSVLNYTSYGYVVNIFGATPSNGSHNLTAAASPTASAVGTEQFGINLVANTAPTSFGANPVQVPDNTFSFGQAATGYNTANQYKYVSGNTIAMSTESSGKTTYTISYIANIASGTPGGTYTGTQTLICTGTY